MNLPVIDTLELSAIAFPANPYHRLVKGYKLLSDSRNDPVKDARLTLDLLVEEVDALFEMQRADPDWVSLLHFLLRAPDRVFTRAQLLQGVWETDNDGYQRNVDCHVTRLRKKLEAAGLSPPPIETIHGVGYRYLPA